MEQAETYNYATPVAQLLNYGKPEVVGAKDWPDYLALGISSQDIPELIRLATDKKLLNADPEAAASWGAGSCLARVGIIARGSYLSR